MDRILSHYNNKTYEGSFVPQLHSGVDVAVAHVRSSGSETLRPCLDGPLIIIHLQRC